MTAPMMPTTAPVRPAATPRSGGSDAGDSAAPFATALDGAMADTAPASRPPARDAGRNHGRDDADNPGRHLGRGREDAPPAQGPRVPGSIRRHEVRPTSDSTDAVPADAPPPAGVPAALWALLLAAATAAPPVAPVPVDAQSSTDGGPAAATPLSGVPAASDPSTVLAGELLAVPAVPTGAPADQVPAVPAPPVAGAPTPMPAAAPAAPVAQPASPPGQTGTGAPADPSADFAAMVATAGATVTTVTTTAPQAVLPRTPAAPEPTGDVPDGGVPAAVPLDPTAGVATPVPVTGAQSGGSGGTGQDGGSSDPSRDGVPDLAGLTPATSTTPITAAPATEAAPAPAPAPPVSGQIAQHIAVLRGIDDGEHSMTLVLTPERLGPVEIQVTVSKGSLDLNLRGAHEQGRAALLEALPDLRRDLQSVGLTCSRLEVDRTTGGAFTAAGTSSPGSSTSGALGQSGSQLSQQQTPGQRGGRPDWSDGRFPSGLRTADSGDNHSVPSSTRSTSPGVDVRV